MGVERKMILKGEDLRWKELVSTMIVVVVIMYLSKLIKLYFFIFLATRLWDLSSLTRD